MKCQICGKDKATIHIREIRNGEKKSYYICEECAAKNGKSFDLAQIVQNITQTLSQLENENGQEEVPPSPENDPAGEASPPGREEEKRDLPRCPGCGWSMEQVRKVGVLGCPECYDSFRNGLMKVLKNVHRGVEHKGMTPGGVSRPAGESRRKKKTLSLLQEEELLQKELQSAVAREEYEQAAILRDKINALKKAGNRDGE